MISGLKLYAAIGLAGAIAVAGIYQTGVNAERKRGEAAELRVRLETLQRDKQLAEKALISEADKAASLERQSQQDQEALDALRKSLAARPEGDRYPASSADLDRLYGPRG